MAFNFTVLFLFFVLFFNCTFQQQPSPSPQNFEPDMIIPSPSPDDNDGSPAPVPSPLNTDSTPIPSPLNGGTTPVPSPLNGGTTPVPSPLNGGNTPVPSPASNSGNPTPTSCCMGGPPTRVCPDGISSVEASCDNSSCKWVFTIACAAAPTFQRCQCSLDKIPQCGNATAVCLPKGTSCAYQCDCDNVCSGSLPCTNAYCGFNQTSTSCQWETSQCTFPLPSQTVNCSSPGACGTKFSNCSNGDLPKCMRTGLTCTNICPAPTGSGLTIDCTGQCWGTPTCNGAKCLLAPFKLQNLQSGVTNVTTSNASIPAQCQWVCPNLCSSWCSSYRCPVGTSLVSCEPSPFDVSTCLPVCTSPVCFEQCKTLLCAVGTAATCMGNTSCSLSCPMASCNDPCAPNCAPICGLGGSRKPCINSTCSLPPNTTLPNYFGASSLSKCAWIPSNDNGVCISEPPKKCFGTPQCASSTCQTDSNGTNYWDNTICKKDCSLLTQSQCPGGFQQCSSGPGFCILMGSDCAWTCPIDPCMNSSGFPTCLNSAPTMAPFSGCISWQTRCLVSNATAVPPVCDWDVKCTQENQSLTGDCLATTTVCGSFPNTTCPGSEIGACLRLSNLGPCQWVYSCPPNLNLSLPCTEADCQTLNMVENNLTTVCGINPITKSSCVRNTKGYCERMSSCYMAFNPPACQQSVCGDQCYDPRWVSGEIVAPDSFNSSFLQQTTLNCSICTRRCSAFLFCGRPSNNPTCQFSPSTAYSSCMAKCNSTLHLLPNSLLNNTLTMPQCSGNDPCSCNYTACTFVLAKYSYGMYSECLPTQRANFALSLPGVQTVYSSVSLPSYCQVLQYGNTNNNTSSAQSLIGSINNLNADALQQDLLNQLSPLTTASFINFIPRISSIIAPSEATALTWDNTSYPLLNIGALVTLTGNHAPTQTDLDNWCYFILDNVIAKTLQLQESQVGFCTLTPVSTMNSTNYFMGTYVLSSVVNPSTISNLTGWVPQPEAYWNMTNNGTEFNNGTGFDNSTLPNNMTIIPTMPPTNGSIPTINGTIIKNNSTTKHPSPSPHVTGPSVVNPPIPPIFPNLTSPGTSVPTITPPINSGTPTSTGPSASSSVGLTVWTFVSVLVVGLFLHV